ncbi:MAG: glycosyltransferase [Terricaulis sp.]
MSIAYFAHELADPAVQKRVKMLVAGGDEVALLGFERKRFANADPAAPKPHVLGQTHNGRLASRVLSVLLAIPRAWRLRAVWRNADALLARNLEMLVIVCVLASVLRLRARVIYECLDIHRMLLKPGPAGKLIRAIERACLKRVSLVVTSSPAFDANYFRAMQHFKGETLVLENKVLALGGVAAQRGAPMAGPPWKIAWCGVLRCKQSFDILQRLAETHPSLVEIELWGAPALDQIPDFHERVAATPAMRFRGVFRPEQLPAIYAEAHFVWAIDYYEAGGNSDWLLPNRLYEGLYFGAVPIAVAGVETARWLERSGVGVVLPAPLAPSLNAFLESLNSESYAPLRQGAAQLDAACVAFTLDNCRALTARLVGAAP